MGQRGSARPPGLTGGPLATAARHAADCLLSILLAPSCAACGELLEHPTNGAVCGSCWAAVLPMTPPLCDGCGDPLPAWRSQPPSAVCDRCLHAERHVVRARAIGPYDGALRHILHALKYEGRRSLAKPLGALMRQRGSDVLGGAHWLVPVPLHPSRRRQRGFNQAVDLARHLDLPICAALVRTRRTRTQADLPATERHRNVLDAFALARGAARRVRGHVIVLVDDVSTTGATLDACARVLKEAGAVQVRALTAARVVSSRR